MRPRTRPGIWGRYPYECPLHDPPLLDHDEAPVAPEHLDLLLGQFLPLWEPKSTNIDIRAFDDLHREAYVRLHPRLPRPLIPTVGKQVQLECRLLLVQLLQELLAAFAVTQIRRQDFDLEQQTEGVNDQMALAALDLLPTVVPLDPPFSDVLTLCESMIPAVGTALRPARCRTSFRSVSFRRAYTPACFHSRKEL